VKLLRALQENEVDPVGSKRPVKVDVRIIAATNRDLGTMAREGNFREDLYYRLNVYPILVPALRDRAGDIAPLARHFIERFAAEENKAVSGVTPQASQLLERFNWPGNVRQLENTIFRAVVLCDGTALDVCDFPQIAAAMGVEAVQRQNPVSTGTQVEGGSPVQPTASAFALGVTDTSGHVRRFEELESEIIRMAIARYDGHMSEVARRLGIGRSTLYRKLKEYGLEGHVGDNGDNGDDGAAFEDGIKKAI
jgi:DNA-binding NtrC family response regulator